MFGKFFPRNEHMIERVIRVVVGVAAIAMVFVGPQTVWGWLGVVPLITGALGRCPAYGIFGVRTCALETDD